MMETTQRVNRRKFLQGVVVSDKMQKTRVVRVQWAARHSKYQKIIRLASKYKAHDEKNQTKVGDVVKIMETRPLSRDKRWMITEVIIELSSNKENFKSPDSIEKAGGRFEVEKEKLNKGN